MQRERSVSARRGRPSGGEPISSRPGAAKCKCRGDRGRGTLRLGLPAPDPKKSGGKKARPGEWPIRPVLWPVRARQSPLTNPDDPSEASIHEAERGKSGPSMGSVSLKNAVSGASMTPSPLAPSALPGLLMRGGRKEEERRPEPPDLLSARLFVLAKYQRASSFRRGKEAGPKKSGRIEQP